jgi:hypothetical protein
VTTDTGWSLRTTGPSCSLLINGVACDAFWSLLQLGPASRKQPKP